ncbi:MAG TPA: Gfo/Idh/MocA family oxidoreductase [Bacteroidales bacterium]|nr:Gfo/Idh/MocA family oxidoreductase [Bacteroidales bacterium]
MDRRNFIGKAALGAGVLTIIPGHLMGGKGFQPPGDRITLGYIGVGKQSHSLLNSLNGCPETIVLAACDVDEIKLRRFKDAAEKANSKKLNGGNQNVDTYENYRELLDRKDIDAVVIVTPDHWHAMIAIDAAKAGKDIYCEKPLALTVAEGRAMVSAARKYDRVFQTGNMQRSWRDFRHACEMVSNGYLGNIKTINVSVGDPHRACELPPVETPDWLNWDLWVGPSLYRSYHPDLAPPIEDTRWALWREYRGFGGGYITDWGAHMFDIAQWSLGTDRSGPVEFIAPGPNAKRGMKMIYANGTEMYHKDWGEFNALQFIGTEGKIEVSREFYRSDMNGLTKRELGHGDKPLYHSENHYQDWIDAIRNRTRPVSDVETGHRTASLCNIINIAYDLERPLHWSPAHERFIDDDDANSLLTRPFRGKWNFTDF